MNMNMDPAAALRMQTIKDLITQDLTQEHRFASRFVFFGKTQSSLTSIMS